MGKVIQPIIVNGNTSERIKTILETEFWEYIKEKSIEIYNEQSLQFELGYYLRKVFTNFNVYIERNTREWIRNTTKHECDIILVNKSNEEKYAIELKFPRNGQYPESMFSFIKDIKYMEELKQAGFKDAFVLTLADDKGFYKITGKEKGDDNIYLLFRGEKSESENYEPIYTINGEYTKPTGDNKYDIEIQGNYHVEWKKVLEKYSIIVKTDKDEIETQEKDIYSYCFRISECYKNN